MSSFMMDTTDDIGGGFGDGYLTQPGTYHCVVTAVHEGTTSRGKPISGFTVDLSALAGTVDGQKEKEKSLSLFNADLSRNESSQKWARKKQTAFVIAVGLLDPSKLGERVEINLQEAVGRQLVVNLEQGEKGLDLAYANIYHVDDPRVAKIPKDKEALGLIPKELRRGPEFFEALHGSGSGKSERKTLSDAELNDL